MAATIFINIAGDMDPLLLRMIAAAPTIAVPPKRAHFRIVDPSRQSPNGVGEHTA